MTPAQIEVALHYFHRENLFPHGSPEHKDAHADLVREGLLERSDILYKRTDRLVAYVQMLSNTPLPVRRWVDPRGEQP